ncbi:hypothetical protein RD792_002749 [Penstemon davidsonii]|uniref:Uncharacterized protein n=1 Tax=Penstemon davidsonii TaxID=160366 RepID=A0ABR0DSR7_9LAMI|nr:hypothetical protein RD792_002749 [Penstemon davidsonii]
MAESMNEKVDSCVARRSANYKPNIWNYDYLQSLESIYQGEKYEREAEALKHEVSSILTNSVENPLNYKLELIDVISKLALSHYFEEEIRQVVNSTTSSSIYGQDPYLIALYFRILRQNGHNVSPDALVSLMDDEGFITNAHSDAKAIIEIFEASHLAMEDEFMLDRAKALATDCLINAHEDNINFPLHWSVCWFNVKKHNMIIQHDSTVVLRLGRLSFNMVQFQHQTELKKLLRWWRSLGLLEVLNFTRDRLVESFLWTIGIAYEPQYGNLRIWLTKAITLVLIIDDVYDLYGSNQELEQLTSAIERWDTRDIQEFPEPIKRCFWALYDTVNDMDLEIQRVKGWNSVLSHLKKVWTNFCKALLVEATWYHTGCTPSFREHLDNGWTSSSGYVLSLYILFGVGQDMATTMNILNNSQEIIYRVSLIIRLCNDLGTSKMELERGDVPSSILCYMREANVTEEDARGHIRSIITYSWKKINDSFISSPRSEQPIIRYIINVARVVNFIYQDGDGFGDQDRETRDQILSCLIEPLHLA